MPPPLLHLPSEADYRAHFDAHYVRNSPLTTFDGLRVRFYSNQFGHAFYTSSTRRGQKVAFDLTRAERMNWIGWALREPSLELYRRVMPGGTTRRIALDLATPYLVVCELLTTDPTQAVFITAYVVTDLAILPTVRGNPRW